MDLQAAWENFKGFFVVVRFARVTERGLTGRCGADGGSDTGSTQLSPGLEARCAGGSKGYFRSIGIEIGSGSGYTM